jgi:pimeloyl-ACP methyl ester carboxylesterase
MGVLDQPDLLEWVRMTQLQDAQARIVLYGFSHSGAVILNCAPQLPSSVVGIVSDSAYSSMHEELLYLLKQQNEGKLQLFLPLVLFSAERYSVWNTGVSVSKSSPITAVARAPIPYLFFHSGSDSQIPVSMAEDIYENAAGLVWDGETGTKELVVMENAEHCQGIWQYPLLYWDHLDRFLLRWMPPEATS